MQFGRCLRIFVKYRSLNFIYYFQAEKSFLDVGEILVGSCKPLEVLLVNKSPCSVTFSLCVQQSPVDEDSESSGTSFFSHGRGSHTGGRGDLMLLCFLTQTFSCSLRAPP